MKSSKKNKSKNLSIKKKNSKKIVENPKIKQKREIKKPEIEEIKQETLPIKEKIIETLIEDKIEEEPLVEDVEKISPEPVKAKSGKKTIIKTEEDINDEKNKVEALLFAHGKYIDESMISELCGVDKRRLKRVLENLREDYEKKDSALAIFQEGNSWKINVREKYLSIVRKIVADTELPKSVMETLAVIAWKSPIYQSEIVRIRGNKCYDHIDVLEEAGFVTKDKKGRSYVLKTTDKFYNYFEIDHGNLKSIFEEVKVPIKEEQKTLEEDIKVPENIDIEKKIEHIEVKKWTETDEEKEQQRQFLDMMEGKIQEVKQKTAIFEEEMPSPKREVTIIEETIIAVPKNEEVPESSEKENPKNYAEATQEDNKRPKSLTKKQLEKKFRDELLRVREKMEKK